MSRLLEMQADEYTESFYGEWLQRRQLPVVSALMDAVADEASEEARKSHQLRDSEHGIVSNLTSAINSDELTPNFIVDVLSSDVLRGVWEVYSREHKESRSLSTAVDGPALFVRALEAHTGTKRSMKATDIAHIDVLVNFVINFIRYSI